MIFVAKRAKDPAASRAHGPGNAFPEQPRASLEEQTEDVARSRVAAGANLPSDAPPVWSWEAR